MLSMLNKLTSHKDLQKLKTQQQQNRKSNIKTVAGTGNWTQDLLQPMQMPYHCTTESTESNAC